MASDYYSGVILANSPYAYYRLGETSGTTAADSGSGNNAGTYHGGFTLNQQPGIGDSNNASVLLNGTNGYVLVPFSSGLSFGTGSFSVEAWIRTSSANPTQGVLSIRDDGSSTTARIIVEVISGVTQFIVPLGQSVVGSIVVNDGNWHHVVCVVDVVNELINIYVDGGLDTQSSLTPINLVFSGTPPLVFGALTNSSGGINGFYFPGNLDEIAIYPIALTAAQVLAHYNAGVFGTTNAYSAAVLAASPLSYWRLDEGSGTVALDRGSLANNGTYSGGAVTLNSRPGVLTNDLAGAVSLTPTLGGTTPNGMQATDPGGYDTAAFSAEIWVNPTVLSAHSQGIFAKTVGGNVATQWVGFLDNNSFLSLIVTTTGGNQQVFATILTAGAWSHVVFVYSAGTALVYVNSILAALLGSLAPLTTGTGNVYIGSDCASGSNVNPFGGLLQEAAIYNYALSRHTILNHYLLGTQGFLPSTGTTARQWWLKGEL